MTLPRSTPAVLRDRTQWHLGANAPVVAWLAALLVITLTRSYVAESPWLMVHLLLLGAVTNAIFVWSSHFADALLRRRATAGSRRWQTVRMVTLNLGVLMVVAGMVSAAWVLTLVGSVIVGTAAAAQGIALVQQIRTALASRFGATVRYYVFAALSLPIGAGLGAALALDPPHPWHGRLMAAHIMTNLLGWVGLTVMGTLVTLWPTMLRTGIAEGAEPAPGAGPGSPRRSCSGRCPSWCPSCWGVGPPSCAGPRRVGRTGPRGANDPATLPKHVPPKHVPETAAVARERHTRQAVVGLALIILAVATGYALAV